MAPTDSAARRIIFENRYMTLATSDPKGIPWASPVAYAVDDELNLYWYSTVDARHSSNISQNSNVSAAIFDSDVMFDEVDGVQLMGNASEVKKEDLARVSKLYWEQCFPDPEERASYIRPLEHFIDNAPQRFYRLALSEVWKYDSASQDNDRRLKVDLGQLSKR